MKVDSEMKGRRLIGRRRFLSTAGAAAGTTGLAGCSGKPPEHRAMLIRSSPEMSWYIDVAVRNVRNRFGLLRNVDLELTLSDDLGRSSVIFVGQTMRAEDGSFVMDGGETDVLELRPESWIIIVNPDDEPRAVYELSIVETDIGRDST